MRHLFLILIFSSLVSLPALAPAQSLQDHASALAAPATGRGTGSAARMLQDLERQEWEAAHPGVPMPAPEAMSTAHAREQLGITSPGAPAASPSSSQTGQSPSKVEAASSMQPTAAEPPQPRITDVTSHAVTTRYLFIKISDSLVRFHVDANLGDAELETIVGALGTSCLRPAKPTANTPGEACDSSNQNSITVDNAFIADVKLSQSAHWSRETTPKGQHWKLTCASGADECFEPRTKLRAFRLTTQRSAQTGRVLAHGFESQAIKALAKKNRVPASSQRRFDRVYVTRTTSERIKLLPKGTL